MSFTSFAHFSDPHLPLDTGLPRPVGLLAGKRMLGYLSWHRRRRHVHIPAVLRTLARDIAAHAPDHAVITGDLVNIALPREFAAARAWLETLGAARDVTVLPGNHEATATVPWPAGLGQWDPWMRGDDGPAAEGDGRFPFVRVRGDVAFVSLSTAVVTPPFIASGRLGPAQIARTRDILDALGRQGLFRVVGLHHPPVAEIGTGRKGLQDAAALRAALKEVGAELVMHGHTHHSHLSHLPGPQGTAIPVVGVPSASAKLGHGRHARWHFYRVSRQGGAWRLSLTVRGLGRDGAFATEGAWTMRLPVAPGHACPDAAAS